jgi:hypothetical protein
MQQPCHSLDLGMSCIYNFLKTQTQIFIHVQIIYEVPHCKCNNHGIVWTWVVWFYKEPKQMNYTIGLQKRQKGPDEIELF